MKKENPAGDGGAEIFYDLLQHADQWNELSWFTRSERIRPMDYSKFALELASPAYIEHFYHLPESLKAGILEDQGDLHRCVNTETVAAIYDQLHLLETMGINGRVTIAPGISLQEIRNITGTEIHLHCFTM